MGPDAAARPGSRGERPLGDDGGVIMDAPPSTSPRGTPWLERKRKPDGSERRYRCQLEHAAASLVVVSYVMRQGGAVFGTPIEIPPGSVSYGYFWRSRPYTVYRMRAGDRVVAHRFDAVAGVRYREGEVAYRDLALDWWLTPGGELIEEDREEFEAAAGSGRLPRSPTWPPPRAPSGSSSARASVCCRNCRPWSRASRVALLRGKTPSSVHPARSGSSCVGNFRYPSS